MKALFILLTVIASSTFSYAGEIKVLPLPEEVVTDFKVALEENLNSSKYPGIRDIKFYQAGNTEVDLFNNVAAIIRLQPPRVAREYMRFCKANGFKELEPCVNKYWSLGTGSTSSSLVATISGRNPSWEAPTRYKNLALFVEEHGVQYGILIFSVDFNLRNGKHQSYDFHYNRDNGKVLVLVTEYDF